MLTLSHTYRYTEFRHNDAQKKNSNSLWKARELVFLQIREGLKLCLSRSSCLVVRTTKENCSCMVGLAGCWTFYFNDSSHTTTKCQSTRSWRKRCWWQAQKSSAIISVSFSFVALHHGRLSKSRSRMHHEILKKESCYDTFDLWYSGHRGWPLLPLLIFTNN